MKQGLKFVLGILIISFGLAGCNNSANPSQFSSNFAGNSAANGENSAIFACQSDRSAKSKLLEHDANHSCYARESYSSGDLPEIAFFIGSQEGITSSLGMDETSFIQLLVEGFVTGAAAINRKACIYRGTLANLQEVSTHPYLEKLAWLGHGGDGDLVSVDGGMISPDQLSPFVSNHITRITFMACEAGEKESQWQSLFSASTNVNFDMSNKDILVDKAADYLVGSYLDTMVACQ